MFRLSDNACVAVAGTAGPGYSFATTHPFRRAADSPPAEGNY
ncbi:MAG: hypothetical protein U0V70_02310 [Terriglobia bacterium]